MEKPTVGRIVHFLERDENSTLKPIIAFAAIITHVIPNDPDDSVLLTLFLPGTIRAITTPVSQGTERGCWKWPPRASGIITTGIGGEA